MSFFQLSKLFRGGASGESSGGRSGRTAISGKRHGRKRKLAGPRRLAIDPLEARELLTVSPADMSDVLASQTLDLYNAAFPEPNLRAEYPAASQFTDAAKALAGDNDGDFVVTWTRNDAVVDSNGQPIIDGITGLPKSDLNIYARYLTDEVQRVFLPSGILDNNNPASFTNGKFSLNWGGNEVQKISVTATATPWSYFGFQQNIQGTITLGFDLNDNNFIDANEQTTVVFNENDFGSPIVANRPQSIIETQLRGLGGVLTDVEVEATDPHTYIVYFGDASQGLDQPLITIVDQAYGFGFFPAAQVSTVREPTTIANISVASKFNTPSLDDTAAAWATAAQIEKAFGQQTSQSYTIAPVDVQAPDHYNYSPPSPAPYWVPNIARKAVSVSAVPVDLTSQGYALGTVFDITFAGNWAKQDVPLMEVAAATRDDGFDLMPLLQADPVKTLKQSSDQFRVNPDEAVDPVTGEPNPLDQRSPSVAMDADGDFVITWESDIADTANPGSVADIYARRFSPIGMVDDPGSVRGFITPGVMTWVNDIQVITFDPNKVGPLVGEFKIQIPHEVTGDPWINESPITFDSRALPKVADDIRIALVTAGYSGARVRQLTGVDPYRFEVTFGGRQAGLDQPAIEIVDESWSAPVGVGVTVDVDDASDSTFQVNTTTTNRQVTPAISMDMDGNFVVTWANVGQDLSYFNRIAFQRYNRDGDPVGAETLPTPQTPDVTAVYLHPAVALSPDGYVALAWETTTDPGFFQGGVYVTSISALIYDLTGTPGNFLNLGAGAAGDPSLAFDPDNNLAVAWNVIVADNVGGGATMDSQAVVFRADGSRLRDPFRINSATGAGTGTASWSLQQVGPQMGFDADGDLIASYDGYGVDMSNELFFADADGFGSETYFGQYINDTTNADLKAFFNPATDFFFGDPGKFSSMSSDVDGAIEYLLINAYNNGATDEQIGRLNAILNQVAGLMRGDANGVMFSRWDTDPNVQATNTVLTADNQANNQRDGQNGRILLAIPWNASTGNLSMFLWRDIGANQRETIPITVAYQQIGNINIVNPLATLDNIRNAMNGARLVGDQWPQNGNWYYLEDDTHVQVRWVFDAELDARATTPWAFPWTSNDGYYVYEMNFQGDAHDSLFQVGFPVNGDRLGTPVQNVYVYAQATVESYGREGTPQFNASLAVSRGGNFVMAWTEQETYTSGAASNTNIIYRRFQDDAGDTAGPLVTDVLQDDGTVLYDNDIILVEQGQGQSQVQQIVIAFDENMMTSGLGSVTSPDNYKLLKNGVELVGGVRSVEFGMNKATDLFGTVPRNRWEAVLTLDGNGDADDVPPLPLGEYEIQLVPGSPSGAGLRDKVGNPLGSSGYNPAGAPFTRTFLVEEMDTTLPPPGSGDLPVTKVGPLVVGGNGRTHQETPGAVAVDADGDYVVVWTAPVSDVDNRDRVYFRLFNADSSNPAGDAGLVKTVGPLGNGPQDAQRFGSVAIDADGDFVVTWTSYDNGKQDVYAQRFNSMGVPQNSEPFRANTHLDGNQKWSGVAMDADGDFVIVWSSYGQENPTTGTGYGVYARRYDPLGMPLAQEFQVNVTTAGDQRFPSVAMDSQGGFVVTWTSSANGVGDDIMYRSFLSDGSPLPDSANTGQGYLFGEGIANDRLDGEQRYSDVSILPDGTGFVISWSSAGQDGSGDGVYARVFPRVLGPIARAVYKDALTAPPPAGQPIPPEGERVWDLGQGPNGSGLTTFYIDVPQTFQIADLDVSLTLRHPRVSDLVVVLVDPQGRTFRLVQRRPQNPTGNYLDGANFSDTIFDDQALTSIATYPQASPPFTGRFIPEQSLTGLNGSLATGVWELRISDQRYGPLDPDFPPAQGVRIPAYLDEWNLDFQPVLIPGAEFRVNTSAQGNQSYPSVAMDRSGNYVIAWSGRGNQSGQDDTEGTGGAFFQRYRYNLQPTPVGGETRANRQTAGDQKYASVGSDADGNFVIVWTGAVPSQPGSTDVYIYPRNAVEIIPDTSAPWITEVQANGSRTFSGDVLSGPVSEMTVIFDELMAFRDGATGLRSVLNPNNWRLTRGGTELPGRIQSIDFPTTRNPATRKFEATIHFSPPLDPSSNPLDAGQYTLTAKDAIYDGKSQAADGPNGLDGDYDGKAGTDFTKTGDAGYRFDFSMESSQAPLAAETLVNENVPLEQRFSSHFGAGLGDEQSTHSLAVDHDGDFVVVWTSYGQDDPNDPTGAGVYARVYDRDNNALSGEIPVNQNPFGDQRNAAVAIDADGEFVVVWESEGQDPNGTWGIYARRFDSMGNPLPGKAGDEFRVNTTIANDQVNPAVAMDDFGNFVVVWATGGQSYSYFNDIRGQWYNNLGERMDREFLVTLNNLPGVNAPGSAETNPAVAMDPLGSYFVVAWDQVTVQQDGAAFDSQIYGRLFNIRDAGGNPILPTANVNPEFAVDDGGTPVTDPEHDPEDAAGGTTTRRRARNPQIAIGTPVDTDDDGNPDRAGFIVAWESFHDNDVAGQSGADSYGVYFRRFGADGTPEMNDDHQANMVATLPTGNTNTRLAYVNSVLAGHQVNPSVAMDADGDYAVVWNGPGAQVHPVDPIGMPVVDADPDGIWIRNFHAQDNLGTPEFVSVQTRVNRTRLGIQEFPTVGMTRDGEKVVAWSGRGAGDPNGIYFRRYPESTDTAGPLVSDVVAKGTLLGVPVETSVGVSLIQPSPASITSAPPAPIVLTSETPYVAGPVSSLVIVFDEDMFVDLFDPDFGIDSVFNRGNYRLLQDGSDISGVIVDVDFALNPLTNKYEATLTIDADPNNPGLDPLPDGQYSMLVTGNLRDKKGNPMGVTGLFQNGYDYVSTQFNVGPGGGNPADEQRVNSYIPGRQDSPAVAKAADGTYVVVWAEYSMTVFQNVGGRLSTRTDNDTGIVTFGVPFGLITGPTIVDVSWSAGGGGTRTGMNATVNGDRVTIDGGTGDDLPAAGTALIVTFTVIDGTNEGNIMAQLFDSAGRPIEDRIFVNTYLTGSQVSPDVAMDDAGNFVVVWSGNGQDGLNGSVDRSGIYYRRFDAFGFPLDVNEHRVNTYTKNVQNQPAVAMDSQGDFVIVWAGEGRAGNPTGKGAFDSRGVWARRYSNAGLALNPYQVAVNATKARSQEAPDVAMDADGDYFVVWRSERQGPGAWSIYGQRYAKTGVRIAGETRLNARAYGAKLYPQVAMDDAGASIVIWSGMRAEGYGDRVYKRQFRANRTAIDPREVIVDDSPAYLKQQAAVTMSGDGSYLAVSWTSYGQDEANIDPPAKSDGVYAHLFFNPDPTNPASKWGEYKVNGSPLGDYRCNATVTGNQNDSAVAMADNGDMTVAWVGPDPFDATSITDIWARSLNIGPRPGSSTFRSSSAGASSGNQSAAQDPYAAVVAFRKGDQASLTDSALNDAFSGSADPAQLLFSPPTTAVSAQPSGSANVATSAASSGAAASLYDSALIDVLGGEGNQTQLTALDATIGLGTSGFGGVNAKLPS